MKNEDGVTIRDGYALFWGQFPSNWEHSPITIDGQKFNCVEQWMMWNKAVLFGDKEAARRIMATDDPADQKRYGRGVRGYDERKWASVRYQVVLRGVTEKYRQNPHLRAKLFKIAHLHFVEASPSDRIWGIGMKASDANATKPGKWNGQNLLGKAHNEAIQTLLQEFPKERVSSA